MFNQSISPIGLPNRKLKIAFIRHPWSVIRPPVSVATVADSIGLIIDETARRLARSHDVIEYCRRGRSQEEIEQFDGVNYRRVRTLFDRVAARSLREIGRVGLLNACAIPDDRFSAQSCTTGSLSAELSRTFRCKTATSSTS
jgi:hypothetical protein